MNRLVVPLLLAATAAHAAITGTLIDESGKPVAGATLRAFAAEDSRAWRARVMRGSTDRTVVATAQSGENGAFRIEIPKTPLADLVIEAPGRIPTALEAPDGEDLQTIVLRAGSAAKLRIVDGGRPVENAIVAAGPFLSRSGSAGSADLPESTGLASRGVVIEPGHAPTDFSNGDEPLLRPDLTLTRGVGVSGRVVAADGQPVPNATLFVAGWPLAQSAADGTFTIAHAPANWRTLIAIEGARTGLVINTRAKSYQIRVGQAASVSGVTLAGARVAINSSADPGTTEIVIADARGNFDSGPLPPGSYTLRALRRGYAPATADVTLKEGARVTRSLSGKPQVAVHGRVIGEDQKPVAGAFVWFGNGLTIPRLDLVATDVKGEFHVRKTSEPGPQAVFAVKPGYGLGTSGLLAEAKSEAAILLPRGFPLQIRIIDKQRQSVAGAVVTAICGSDNDPLSIRYPAACEEPLRRFCRVTGDDGTVTLRATEGPYGVRVAGPSIVPKTSPQSISAGSSPLTIEVNRGVEVSGRVTFTDGTPVAGALVTLRPVGLGARAGDDGTFTLGNAPAGRISLAASIPDQPQFVSAPVEIDAPARNVAVTIPTPARIEGRVVDKESGQPVTDFQMAWSWRETRPGPSMRPSSFHSDDGSFLLDHVSAGPIRLQVTASGYAPWSLGDLTAEEGKTLRGIEVMLERGGQVRGKVTSAGQPVSGVNIGFGAGMPFGRSLSGTATDDNGEYVIESIGPGEQTIDFSKGGLLPARKKIDVVRGKETRLDVEMDRGRELHGAVSDKSGRPIAAARITAMSTMGSGGYRPASSDADGTFMLDGLADGRYTVTATKEGFVNARVNDVVVPAQGPLALTLDTGGTIGGRVTGLSETDLMMTSVSAVGAGGYVSGRVNPDGTFVLRGVPDGHINVTAYAGGAAAARQSAPKSVDVVNGAAPSVDIDFAEGITVTGHVTRGGMPFTGAGVNFSGPGKVSRSGFISPDGRYEVGGLVPGDYDVTVSAFMGGRVFQGKDSVAGNSTYDIQLDGATLRGRVIDSSTGAPIPDASVSIYPNKDYPLMRQTTSDSDGRFVLDILPDGAFDVHASSRQHYAPATQSVTVSGGSAPDLELRLDPGQATAFRIVDAQSGAAIDAFISIGVGSGGPTATAGPTRDDDGAIHAWLAPGHYKAFVNARGYINQQIEFSTPGPDVRVAMQQGGRLILIASKITRVRLNSAGAPPMGSGGVMSGARMFAAGPMGFNLENLAPGIYTLDVLADDMKTVVRSMPVTVVAGQTTTVNVD